MLELIVCQRKVFTTPVHNEADDASVTNILPSDRGLNKKRGCAAVSIGEKRQPSDVSFMAERFCNGKRPLRKNHVVRPEHYEAALP